MVDLETRKALFEAAIGVFSAAFTCVLMNEVCNAWHEWLGLCADKLLRASIFRTHGVKLEDLTEIIGCKPYATKKATKTTKRNLEIEDRKTAKLPERGFS